MASTTPLSEAEKRTVKLVNIHGDPVKYSGNPAELAGARYEADLCMGRLGHFKMLIKHNAARMPTGSIAVEDLDTIPFVTKELTDPHMDSYTYENPCPSTALRRARYNIAAAMSGTPRHTGVPNLNAVPQPVLKTVTLAPYEVEIEDHAYALTQLSMFEDRKHANELLQKCELSGRKLRAFLDDIENTATGEDLSLVTGRRDLVVQAGLKGRELTQETYELYFKEFNDVEVKCPPISRKSDDQLRQMIGDLFIRDTSLRKSWSDHINLPEMIDGAGVRRSGPPRNFAEAKLLAEKILRSNKVTSEIDQQNRSSIALLAGAVVPGANAGLSTEHQTVLAAAGIDYRVLPIAEAAKVAAALLSDPRKTLGGGPRKEYVVPRGEDGKPTHYVDGMDPCDCGTPDGGKHLRYKWPCAYAPGGEKEGQRPKPYGKGKGKGGKGKGGGKGKWDKKQAGAVVEGENNSDAATDVSTATAASAASANSASSAGSSVSAKQVCAIAKYDDDAELQALLSSESLANDLKALLQSSETANVVEVRGEIKQYSALIDNLSPSVFRGAGSIDLGWAEQVDCLHGAVNSTMCTLKTDPTFEFEGVKNPFDQSGRLLIWDSRVGSERTAQNSELPDSSGRETLVQSAPSVWSDVSNPATFPPFVLPSAGGCGKSEIIRRLRRKVVHRAFIGDHGAYPASQSGLLPIFRAHPDSGCTASCTNHLERLTNVRKCVEEFNVADGKTCECVAIGDMPIMAKNGKGEFVRITFRNVRYVPGFKYTLLSVKQIWKEQKLDARFADLNHLSLPGGATVPYDTRFNLVTITMLSEPMIKKGLDSLNKSPSTKSAPADQTSLLGFHNVKSTSHVAKLPIAQASELLHRRSHLGVVKIRSLHHVTSDVPRSLTSATQSTCVHCAASQIRRAGHSSSLDTPSPEPGDVHVDVKGPFPISVHGKYRYAVFFIDEFSRFVFVFFIQDKSQVVEATRLMMAKFNALVGTPVDEDGKALDRPRVRRLHRDHEGGLESKQFESFRAHEKLHTTTSAPHDHDLNPIAESTINVISTLSTTYKSQCGAPIGFWPELIRHAVDWHNSASQQRVGSSTADPIISPFQRFTLKQPKVMDLATFGSRCVVLKPPTHQSKTTMSSRGWIGMFLGRCTDSPGTYEVWVPSINKKVRSSTERRRR